MKVGILGASGAVGRQMITCIRERDLPLEELRLFSSERSAGRKIDGILLQKATKESLAGLDYVLGAVEDDISREYAPLIRKSGAVYIDNSKAFRLDEDVPLVVPEINGTDALKHHGIIANPNCSTIITCMAIYPIAQLSPICKVIASTYQAVSGAGIRGLKELEEETKALAENREVQPAVFSKQIAFNCIPLISSETENGYTSEEMKLLNEGRKIMHLPDMQVTCTCVRVPVYRSHSISVSLQCERALSVEEVRDAIRHFDGTVLAEDGFPTPLESSDQDLVYVGRVRRDLVFEGGISLWCCGDQIRKGAATNAVQIMEYLLTHPQ